MTPVSQLVAGDAAARLLRRLASQAEELERGAHVVLMTGNGARCFGPFPSRSAAVAAASVEKALWAAEFPAAPVTFEVLALSPSDHVGRVAS